MRRSKVIPIEVAGKKEVTVKEVSPYALYKALLGGDKIKELVSLAQDCIDLTPEQLQNLYASEGEIIIDGLLEVNQSFLGIASKLGIKETLVQIIVKALDSMPQFADEMLKNLPPVFSVLYKRAMEKMPGITAGAAS